MVRVCSSAQSSFRGGAPLRYEADRRVDREDGSDGQGSDRLPEEKRHRHGHGEKEHDQALELVPKDRPQAAMLDGAKAIGPHVIEPLMGVRRVEPVRRGLECVHHLPQGRLPGESSGGVRFSGMRDTGIGRLVRKWTGRTKGRKATTGF